MVGHSCNPSTQCEAGSSCVESQPGMPRETLLQPSKGILSVK